MLRHAVLKKVLATAILLISCAASASAQQQDDRPNVLFIAVDDLNDWVGPFGGYKGVITPNLDKLAAGSEIFTRAYCSAPSCNPSRASLLTGVRPSTSGVYLNEQPWRPVLKDAVTIPQYFTRNGYDVEGIGKIFHDSYNDTASWPVYFKVVKSPAPANAPVKGKGNFDWSPVDVANEQMGDYKNVDHAIDFFKADRDKPFFLAVGFTRPHLPWYVPRKYFDLYPLDKIQLPAVINNDLDDIPPAGVKIARRANDHEFIVANGQWKNAVQGYLASITFADEQIGRLLDALAASKYADNTIVVLWGDHGWSLGQKEHWRKFALWEETTRVPLFIKVPGVTKNRSRSSRTVNLMDLYPTLIDLCRLPTKSGIEGRSLVPLLNNPGLKWDYPSVSTWGYKNHAVRSERWRYIKYADGSEELYDHDNDPHEWKNLAKDSKYSSVKNELAKWLPKVNALDAPRKKGAGGE
ncbi:MAG: sulfatase [Chitinophagaceae bacterium]